MMRNLISLPTQNGDNQSKTDQINKMKYHTKINLYYYHAFFLVNEPNDKQTHFQIVLL